MAGNPPTENTEQIAAPAANANGTQPSEATAATAAPPSAVPPGPESRLPTRKDASLKEFLNKMDDYAPIIPDAVTNYYMTRAGLPPPPQTDQRLARLLALATQKFIADIAPTRISTAGSARATPAPTTRWATSVRRRDSPSRGSRPTSPETKTRGAAGR